MKLRLLLVNVAAIAAIGLALADVAFVLWMRDELAARYRERLYVAAVQVIHAPLAQVPALAAEYDVIYTWIEPDGPVRSSTTFTLPSLPATDGLFTEGGMEHLTMRVDNGRRLVVSHRLSSVLKEFYDLHQRALVVLTGCGAVMVLFGALFLRRAVAAPLQRLTQLVAQHDRDAMLRLEGGDDAARLGHAIITMTHSLEEDRERIAAQLQALAEAQRQLVRAERLAVVGTLAAGLAHEIGNPLAVLGGFVELLADPALDATSRREALERMSKELQRIQRTVRQLLDFSRAPRSEGQAGDVAQALVHTQRLLEPQERLRGIALDVPTLFTPLPVTVDTDALTQVLLNLLLNAADALQRRGTIAIRVAAEPTQVRLQVEDSGPGIPDDVLPRVFEPFFTTKPAGGGTGLGLAVCERIIAAAGGDITAGRSAALGGACFTLVLPAPGVPKR